MKEALAGQDGTNRWADKSCCEIYFKTGTTATLSEHSMYDAMVMVEINTYLESKVIKMNGKWQASTEESKLSLIT